MPSKRRKGEKPVIHEPVTWSETGVIARIISTGTGWLDAWIMQQGVPLDRLSRRSGLAPERLRELLYRHDATRDELAAMAPVFNTDLGTMFSSMEFGRAIAALRPARPPLEDDEPSEDEDFHPR